VADLRTEGAALDDGVKEDLLRAPRIPVKFHVVAILPEEIEDMLDAAAGERHLTSLTSNI
jgi:hypothetical protein